MVKPRPAINRIVMTAAVIVVGALLLIFGVIKPLLASIENVQAEASGVQSRIANLDAEIESYQTAIEELEKVEEGREQIARMFPAREDMVTLIEELETAVSSAGAVSALNLTDEQDPGFGRERQSASSRESSPAAPSPKLVPGLTGVEEVPYSLSLTGSFRELADFLLYFDNMTFISEIDNITINAERSQSSTTQVLNNTGVASSKIEGVLFIRQE